MMSKQTKIHVPIGILYRWMYPAVNPYSCGDRSVFTCVPMGRLASICDTTDRTRQKYCRSRQEDPVIKSHGQRLDLAPCRSHQWASSCLVRIIHDGSSSPSLTLPHSMPIRLLPSLLERMMAEPCAWTFINATIFRSRAPFQRSSGFSRTTKPAHGTC